MVSTQLPSFVLVERPFGEGVWYGLTQGTIVPISPPVGAKPLYFNHSSDILISSRVEKKDVSLFLENHQKKSTVSFPRDAVILSACLTKKKMVWVLYLDQSALPIVKGVVSIFPVHKPDSGKSYLISGKEGVRAKMRARNGRAIERVPVTLICREEPLIVMDEWSADLTMIHLYSFNESDRVLRWKTGLSKVSHKEKISVRFGQSGRLQLFNGSSLTTLDASTGFPRIEHFDDDGEMLFSQDSNDQSMIFIPKNQKEDKKVGRILNESPQKNK
ncbi:hypothetical protein KAH37_05295 [bacterium]|nr:hypothetical protein [bacterium]